MSVKHAGLSRLIAGIDRPGMAIIPVGNRVIHTVPIHFPFPVDFQSHFVGVLARYRACGASDHLHGIVAGGEVGHFH